MSESTLDQAAGITEYDVSEWLSLEPGEEVEWVGEPTKMRLVGTVITGVVTIPFIIGLFILLGGLSEYLTIKHTHYVVTNRSLYVKKGVTSTNIESVDLDRIQNTEFTQSFWGKQFGFGTIEISTAGSAGADISFDDVENAREIRELISRMQRQAGGRTDYGSGEDTAERQAARADKLDELVAELRGTREALERIDTKLDSGGSDGGGDSGVEDRSDATIPSSQETTIDQSGGSEESSGTDPIDDPFANTDDDAFK